MLFIFGCLVKILNDKIVRDVKKVEINIFFMLIVYFEFWIFLRIFCSLLVEVMLVLLVVFLF